MNKNVFHGGEILANLNLGRNLRNQNITLVDIVQ